MDTYTVGRAGCIRCPCKYLMGMHLVMGSGIHYLMATVNLASVGQGVGSEEGCRRVGGRKLRSPNFNGEKHIEEVGVVCLKAAFVGLMMRP